MWWASPQPYLHPKRPIACRLLAHPETELLSAALLLAQEDIRTALDTHAALDASPTLQPPPLHFWSSSCSCWHLDVRACAVARDSRAAVLRRALLSSTVVYIAAPLPSRGPKLLDIDRCWTDARHHRRSLHTHHCLHADHHTLSLLPPPSPCLVSLNLTPARCSATCPRTAPPDRPL